MLITSFFDRIWSRRESDLPMFMQIKPDNVWIKCMSGVSSLSLVPQRRDAGGWTWPPMSFPLTREMAAQFLWIPHSTGSSGRSAERPYPWCSEVRSVWTSCSGLYSGRVVLLCRGLNARGWMLIGSRGYPG